MSVVPAVQMPVGPQQPVQFCAVQLPAPLPEVPLVTPPLPEAPLLVTPLPLP
jgi:hypothetical protein